MYNCSFSASNLYYSYTSIFVYVCDCVSKRKKNYVCDYRKLSAALKIKTHTKKTDTKKIGDSGLI